MTITDVKPGPLANTGSDCTGTREFGSWRDRVPDCERCPHGLLWVECSRQECWVLGNRLMERNAIEQERKAMAIPYGAQQNYEQSNVPQIAKGGINDNLVRTLSEAKSALASVRELEGRMFGVPTGGTMGGSALNPNQPQPIKSLSDLVSETGESIAAIHQTLDRIQSSL